MAGASVGRHDLPRGLFDAMIDARYPELDKQPVDPDASEGSLVALAARMLGAGDCGGRRDEGGGRWTCCRGCAHSG